MSNHVSLFNGIADGALLTVGGGGGGNSGFSNVAGAPTGSTSNPYEGNSCARFNATGAASNLTYTHASTISEHHARYYVRPDTMPSANVAFFSMRNSDNTGAAFDVRCTTAGLVQLRNSTGVQQAVSTNALPVGQWSRIEVDAVNGSATIRLYLGAAVASSTPTETLTAAYASTVMSRSQVGVLAAATWDVSLDAYEGNDLTQPGPLGGGGPAPFVGWGIPV